MTFMVVTFPCQLVRNHNTVPYQAAYFGHKVHMESQHGAVPSRLLRTQSTHGITTPCRTKPPTSDTKYTWNHNTVPYQAAYFGHKVHMESQHRAVPSRLLRTQSTHGITTRCRTKPPTSDTKYTWNHNTVPYQAAYFGHKVHMESQHGAVPSRLLRTQSTHGITTPCRTKPPTSDTKYTWNHNTVPYQAAYFGHKVHMESQHRAVPSRLLRTQSTHGITTRCRTKPPTSDTKYTWNHNTVPYQAAYFGHKVHMESQHGAVPSRLLRTQSTHGITTPCRTKPPTSDTKYTWNHNTVPYQAAYFGHKVHMESQHRAVPSRLLRTQSTHGITTRCRTKPPTSDTKYTWNHNTVPYQAAYFGHKVHMESQHRAVPSHLLRTQTAHGITTPCRTKPPTSDTKYTWNHNTVPYQAAYFGHKVHMESQHRAVPSRLLRTQSTHGITTPCRTKPPTSDTKYTWNHNTVPYQATYFGHKLHMESQHRAVPSRLLRTQTAHR